MHAQAYVYDITKIHTYMYTRAYVFTYTFTRTPAHINVHALARTHAHTCTHIHTHTHTHHTHAEYGGSLETTMSTWSKRYIAGCPFTHTHTIKFPFQSVEPTPE